MGGRTKWLWNSWSKENAFTLWSLDDALDLDIHIEQTVALAAVWKRGGLTYKAHVDLRVVVRLQELKGTSETLLWLEKRLAKRTNKIDPSENDLMVVEAAPNYLKIFWSQRKDADKAERSC